MRAETGNMRFDDDWTGVFIRGDNAFAFAMHLEALLGGSASFISTKYVEHLLHVLQACNHQTAGGEPPAQLAQMVKPLPEDEQT